MEQRVAPRERTNAIVLLPGFETAVTQESSLNLLLTGIRMLYAGRAYHESIATIEGLSGKKIFADGQTTDIFEIEWKTKFDFASQAPWWQKLPRGLALLSSFLNIRIIGSVRESPLWSFGLISSTVLIVLWMYGALAVGIGAIGDSGLVPSSGATWLSNLGQSMLHQKVWIYATAFLTASNVDLDRSIDLSDLLRRYLFGKPDASGVTMRSQLRDTVAKVVPLVAGSGYAHVSIVAHSFGAVMALDYLANEHDLTQSLRLVTLGSFLKFLSTENPSLIDPLIDGCLANPIVYRSQEFYSKNDWLATTTPIRKADSKFTASEAVPHAAWWPRITGKTHSYYFADQTVVRAIMSPA
jgi:hypothetical protein